MHSARLRWIAAALSGLALHGLTACGDETINPVGTGGTAGTGGGSTELNLGHPPRKQPPLHIVGTFGIDVPEITLAPGEERIPCWLFPLVIDGPSRLVGGGSLTVGAGMHHGNITTRVATGEGVRECPPDIGLGAGGEGIDILHGGAVLFGSSTQVSGVEWQSFPEGMAYRVRDGFEIVARMHYLNTSDQPVTVAPKYQWYTVDEGFVTEELGPFAWIYSGFSIPPNSEKTVTGSCAFPAPVHVVDVLPHMHKLGTAFTAGYYGGERDGDKFLDSPGYDPENGVMVQYEPAVDLSQGYGVSFSCTWKNTLDITVGEGLGSNEMCILFGYAYPPENAFSATAHDGSCLYLAPPVK